MIIHLGPTLPPDSSGLPEGDNETGSLSPPIWPCTGWGLPCLRRHRRSGALLPHLFTFALLRFLPQGGPCVFCGTFRGITPRPRYGPPCPVVLGLSSPPAEPAQRSSSLLWALQLYCVSSHLSNKILCPGLLWSFGL
jgi:hypothetical protein